MEYVPESIDLFLFYDPVKYIVTTHTYISSEKGNHIFYH